MRTALLGTLGMLLLSTLAAPAHADIGRPHAITTAGHVVESLDQATDAHGDTTYLYYDDHDLMIRVRMADGRLRKPVPVADGRMYSSYHLVAVDHDGDGVVVWDVESPGSISSRLRARRFTRTGRLGPMVYLSQRISEYDYVSDAHVAVRRGGLAVIGWSLTLAHGNVPYVRTLRPDGHRGPLLKVGSGQDASAPIPVPADHGRTLLVWSNGDLRARYLVGARRLRPIHRMGPPQDLNVYAAARAADGTTVVGCTWFDMAYRACLARLSPRLRLLGKLHVMSPRDQNINPGVQLGLAPHGEAVITWLVLGYQNPQDGGWARALDAHGVRGPVRRLNTNGQNGPVSLTGHGDGAIASAVCGSDGSPCRYLRMTRVHHGQIERSSTVRTGRLQNFYWRPVVGPSGRVVTSYLHGDRIYAVAGW